MRTRWACAVRTSLLLSGGLTVAADAAALQVIDAVEGETVLAKI